MSNRPISGFSLSSTNIAVNTLAHVTKYHRTRCPRTRHTPLLSCLNRTRQSKCPPEHTPLIGCSAGSNIQLQGTWANPTDTTTNHGSDLITSDQLRSQPDSPPKEAPLTGTQCPLPPLLHACNPLRHMLLLAAVHHTHAHSYRCSREAWLPQYCCS
jgi:hypothetical protein